jgi:hypothetical protein
MTNSHDIEVAGHIYEYVWGDEVGCLDLHRQAQDEREEIVLYYLIDSLSAVQRAEQWRKYHQWADCIWALKDFKCQHRVWGAWGCLRVDMALLRPRKR